MSRLIQIEYALRAIDGARFHQLCDTYLTRRGYPMNPFGRSLGVDKVRRGTPDSWALLPNGKYLFAEYTTQQTQVLSKLLSDLAKCLDEEKTGVPVAKIQHVTFVHTAVLSPADQDVLIQEARRHGVEVTQIGIGPLTHDILQNYPDLARDYLNLEIDTGQIVSLEEFIALYGRNALATPLDITFRFREDEVVQVLAALDTADLVIVSGRTGVGKSRLVVECARLFATTQPSLEVRCIYNRGANLFEDLRLRFAGPGDYLVIVDDANRLDGLGQLLQLLHDVRPGRRIKVIATVRDYALSGVREEARPYGGGIEVAVGPLTDSEIESLVENVFELTDLVTLNRIVAVAKGYPRLAVMMARVAQERGTVESIQDVSALFDEYYSAVREKLDAFGDPRLIRVAGIVAFFGTLDRADEARMEQVAATFGVPSDAFWDMAERLHRMELLEMYENEVVKIADQVLATYLFYLACFKVHVLDFTIFLGDFYPHPRERLMDALKPVMSAFGSTSLLTLLRPHVERAWDAAAQAADEDRLLHMAADFWFLRPSEALILMHERIEAMQPIPRGELNSNYRQTLPPQSPSILKVLASFREAGEEDLRTALALLLEYALKRPNGLPQFLRIFHDSYGFSLASSAQGYVVERSVVDTLIGRLAATNDPLFAIMFLETARTYLETAHSTMRVETGRDRATVRFRERVLEQTPQLTELRQRTWSQLFALAEGAYQPDVLHIIREYVSKVSDPSAKAIVAEDARELLPFLSETLDAADDIGCALWQEYLDALARLDIPFSPELRDRFRSDLNPLVELLSSGMRSPVERAAEENNRVWRERLREHFASYEVSDYIRFFGRCAAPYFSAESRDARNRLRDGIATMLHILAERDPALYASVLTYYLALDDLFDLLRHGLVALLVDGRGARAAHEVLTTPEYQRKNAWLFEFHRVLPPEAATREFLAEIYDLYRTADPDDFPAETDFLLKYAEVNSELIARLVEILTERAEHNLKAGRGLALLLDSQCALSLQLPVLFSDRLEALKHAYRVACRAWFKVDPDGTIFGSILEMDAEFAVEYVKWTFADHVSAIRSAPDVSSFSRDYAFLWRREDHARLMTKVVDCLYALEVGTDRESCLRAFLSSPEDDKDLGIYTTPTDLIEQQDRFLADLLASRAGEQGLIEWLFDTVAWLPEGRRRPLIGVFLAHNANPDDFDRLKLGPELWSHGSLVPTLEGRIDFLNSLLPFLGGITFLRHRRCIERQITELRDGIVGAKRKEFVNDHRHP